MRRRLPPLNALRAYEAAARHLSFTRASRELFVTQAAVSHQVKALEDHLGVRLFRRLNRSLLLTEAGQAYLPAVTQALDLVDEATRRLLRAEDRGTLTVSTLPSFAARWLVPRLGRFFQSHPGIDIRVAPSHTLVDFDRDDVDVGIRYGKGRYPGLRVDKLFEENLYPVCSPRLVHGRHPLHAPADLKRHTLLHDDPSEWSKWLRTAGVADLVDASRGSVFTDSSMLIQAAIAEQGVALVRHVLAADDVAAGRLVRPFDLSIPADDAYFLVCPQTTAEQPKITAFREWVLGEAEAERGD
jgi:LysR family glycine cleavage system transcriptional activator